jgi:predicted DNA-binding transcriptional regulator AlpA
LKTPRRPLPPGWITREQLAARYGMSVSNIDKMTISGRLPAPYQFGSRCILFALAEIEAHERAANTALSAFGAKTQDVGLHLCS